MKSLKIIAKRFIVLLLSLTFTISLCIITTYSRQRQVCANTDYFETVSMYSGSAIKLGVNDDVYGLRYALTMDKTKYQELMQNVGSDKYYKNLTFGIIIAPANFTKLFGEINKDTVFGENAIYYWQGNNAEDKHLIINNTTSRLSYFRQDSNLVCFYNSIIDIESNYITSNFVGIGYIMYETSSGVDYNFYYNDECVRNIYQVALSFLDDENNSLDNEQILWVKENYIYNEMTSVTIMDGELNLPDNAGKLSHVNENIVISSDSEIPVDYTIVIDKGCTLTINEGVTLRNNGKIINNGNIITNGIII